MEESVIIRGYLDVKISSKSRRGFTPWRAWQKQWCEIRRLDDIVSGVELKLRSSEEGSLLNCINVPRSAILCRTDSKTKQYAFGVFNLSRMKKPIIFLAGCNESESQEWMHSIRKMLSIASYIPVGDTTFRVSLIDNAHSRNAGLVGLHGILSATSREISVNDSCTGSPKAGWRWYHFHHFNLRAACQVRDNKKVVVLYTTNDFPAGSGQLFFYCEDGVRLLHYLLSRGSVYASSGLICTKRYSRSEGDLYNRNSVLDSSIYFYKETGREDSGVASSEDADGLLKSRTETNITDLSMTVITKTPGGSETEDSYTDLCGAALTGIKRNESGISLASGIYEEIADVPEASFKATKTPTRDNCSGDNIYENEFDLVFDPDLGHLFKPPPLPPRKFETFSLDRRQQTYHLSLKHRCNTLPARELLKMSMRFTGHSYEKPAGKTEESEYVDMSGGKKKAAQPEDHEDHYTPMGSPQVVLENPYTCMTRRTKIKQD